MTSATSLPELEARKRPMSAEERKVIIASSAGTIFEWYDFYLYGALAATIGAQFFSAYPEATRNVFALLAFAAGFLVRPFGAIFFGRLGDLIGRKYTFLITILIMGVSTFLVGLLPSYNWFNEYGVGWVAPATLIALRMLQGLALGGEYGGAAIYVAEHAPQNQRGYFTSWIQTTATLGLLLSLLVILFTQIYVNANYPPVAEFQGGKAVLDATGKQVMTAPFASWGWRVPFLVSIFLLIISLYIRLSMNESPAFKKMKEEGALSKAPLSEAFGPPTNALVLLLAPVALAAAFFGGFLTPAIAGYIGLAFVALVLIWGFVNARIPLLALLGLVAGQAVIWYTGQFYALFFLQSILKVDQFTANVMIAWSLILGTSGFIIFGSLSDKIGRKPIILGGCLLGALLYAPSFIVAPNPVNLFTLMSKQANPALSDAWDKVKVTVVADPADCSFQFNPTGTAKFTNSCDILKASLARASVNYTTVPAAAGKVASVKIGDTEIAAYDAAKLTGDAARTTPAAFNKSLADTLTKAGYPAASNPSVVKIAIEPKDGLGNFAKLFDIFTPQRLTIIGILTMMVILVTMVYGPIAAALVELFPTRIRYTGLSLPYHVGNGWFGGLMPATSFAMVAQTGDTSFGLWYPVAIALMTVVIGILFVPETYKREIFKN
jgi:MFS family permease